MKRNSKTDWERVLTLTKEGRVNEVPAEVQVRHYASLKRIAIDNMINVARQNIVAKFFWGRTGSGKSHTAWEEATMEAYIKNPNTKWWDGYRGQENVIIDEFTGLINISYLLIWLDKYPCSVEVKGFSVPLRATKFWITSNLSLEECYPDVKEEQISALRRRLEERHFQQQYNPNP